MQVNSSASLHMIAPMGAASQTTPFMFGKIPNMFSTPTILEKSLSQRSWSSEQVTTPDTPTTNSASIRGASHHVLLGTGNAAYVELWEQNVRYKAEIDSLQSAYDRLLGRVNSISEGVNGVSPPVRLKFKKEDYPGVTIWYANDWTKHPKNKRSDAAGFNQSGKSQNRNPGASRDSLAYIQDEHGTSISERNASDVCFYARQVWEHLAGRNMAPQSWGRCEAPARQYYLDEMYKHCPELAFCEGDWKADRLATDNYTGWMRGRKKAQTKVKEEHDVKLEDIGKASTVVVEGMKRKEGPSTNVPIKGGKVPRLTMPNNASSCSTTSNDTEPMAAPLSAEATAAAPVHSPSNPGAIQTPATYTSLALPSTSTPTDLDYTASALPSPHIPHDAPVSQTPDSPSHFEVVDERVAVVAQDSMPSNTDSQKILQSPAGISDQEENVSSSTTLAAETTVETPLMPIKARNSNVNLTACTGVSQATLKKDLFKYQPASCSARNLFGKSYVDQHGPTSKDVVMRAFDALSEEERGIWDARRAEELARKNSNKKGTKKGHKAAEENTPQ
ncbi:hypothetical protein H0H93_006681 [Arthromyces matolae]|nr:hypothetical protein H0H93_006681 [Arthromyces matolae]